MCIIELLENTGNFKNEEKNDDSYYSLEQFYFISFQSFCLHMGFKI